MRWLAILLLSAWFGADDVRPGTESVNRFLHGISKFRNARTVVALRDLDGDGKPEALVYLTGSEWCGSGGCRLLVLAPRVTSWKIVTEISITRPPIRVMTTKTKGWSDLSVWTEGGGIQPGYESELSFDGKTYPNNPTVSPARRAPTGAAGEIAIPR
jgi:hypothetical protein